MPTRRGGAAARFERIGIRDGLLTEQLCGEVVERASAAGVPWRDHDDTGVPDCDDDGVERGEPPPGRRAFRIERRPDLGFGGFS